MQKKLLNGKRVLIVDDEPDVLDTLEDLLPMCQVFKASTFEKAKQFLEADRFDIAILDIMGVNGYELLALTQKKNVISVMLTAQALSPEDVKKSYIEGASFYIPKEEMSQIDGFLEEVLDALAKGQNPWNRWIERMAGFCEKTFGARWQQKDPGFWDNFPFY
ncbi:MAG TPA: response regulator [Desulfatirhabdiaceae bacterium]|nr:response regulator [Desulfatirhabdiaceae bacterium]